LGNAPLEQDNFFEKRLLDSNEDIRKAALSAIYKSQKEAAAVIAMNLLEKDASWLVRYKAIEIINSEKPEGYKKVLTKAKEKEENRYILEKISSALGI